MATHHCYLVLKLLTQSSFSQFKSLYKLKLREMFRLSKIHNTILQKNLANYSIVLYWTFFILKYLNIPYPVTVINTAIARVEPTAIGAVSSRYFFSALHSNASSKLSPLYMNGCTCNRRNSRLPRSPAGGWSSSSVLNSTSTSLQECDLPTGVGISIWRWYNLIGCPIKKVI